MHLKELAAKEIEFVLSKIDSNLDKYGYDTFPRAASVNNVYEFSKDNNDWTEGFWTGMLWNAYRYTKNPKYKDAAMVQTRLFQERFDKNIKLEHHDLGFLYIYSCVYCYELTGDETALEYAIKAADKLMTRYNEKAGVIQAWGDLSDPNQSGRFIIDCLINIPLLFWASEITGDKKYYDAAYRHAKASQKYIVRPDNSTFHTFHMDVVTGEPRFGTTHQGYSDSSCWARGQAWGVYGFPLAYKHTKDTSFLETAYRITDYFLEHLPKDSVPFWDLIFTDGDKQPRDSSSGAIALCGMLEQLGTADEARKSKYMDYIEKITTSLANNYATKNSDSNGILLHATYALPQNNGIDECNIWGDHYYFEALIKIAMAD